MKVTIVIFPGTNREQNMAFALEKVTGKKPNFVWHKDKELGRADLVVIPGGFSYGDYLRCGAMAAHSPVMHALRDYIAKGGYVLGVCNGFQVLTEMHVLPGALRRNRSMRFLSQHAHLRVENPETAFSCAWTKNDVFLSNLAHGEGNYTVGSDDLNRLEGDGRIAFRYVDEEGARHDDSMQSNPNGSMSSIAGVLSQNKRVCGMMPHPEDCIDPLIGGEEGLPLFKGLVETIGV